MVTVQRQADGTWGVGLDGAVALGRAKGRRRAMRVAEGYLRRPGRIAAIRAEIVRRDALADRLVRLMCGVL
jgi:hypothetical protein